MIVVAFDFDGTLTTKDTLLAFIKYSKGTFAFMMGFSLYFPILVLMKLRLYPNWKAKEKIFSYFFKGMQISIFNNLCKKFAREKGEIMRPEGLSEVKKHIEGNRKILIVSASIDNWVAPFFDNLPIQIVGTKIEIDKENRITGKFLTKNCYGKEKVKRILEIYPNRNEYELWAYGDSCGDLEMLEFANKKFYRKFI